MNKGLILCGLLIAGVLKGQALIQNAQVTLQWRRSRRLKLL